ncbi:hypothetical protein [Haloarchaeobius amylolyticus]|uniref:hypothetical protein n=1 Tax=Haloarchaeobius amylolyticus TaxID=1198296 RepID=UPI00226EB297|nr:hypothetical protein [Haloarchaeobius amylolyticus]
MGDNNDRVDDHISKAIVHGNTYERLRVSRYSFFSGSLARKLTHQGVITASLVAILPLALAAPPELAVGDPSVASPKVVLLGLFGLGVEVLAGTALVAVALARLRLDDIGERAAHRLLNVEDVASMLGLGTGAIAILVTVCYFGVASVAPGALETLRPAHGGGAFAASGTGLTVTMLAALAVGIGVALLLAGRLLDDSLGY